mmetsp:Transcript_98705/g.287915  ORF Transcript_98705/g.287915 Transcript_98705/m.287915 type:complete len:584 (-) Transcript_98705:211-1962(-)
MAIFPITHCPALLTAMLTSMVGTAQSSAFRGSSAAVISGHMQVQDLRNAMLDELMSALGHGNRVTEQRLADIKDTLQPMFRSLQKNEYGNLDHSGVRYALHRLFVLRHGMFIKGLDPAGAGWAVTSPTEVLDDLVPAYVQDLFEQQLHGRGLGLHEIATLAATLEHLIHDQAVEQLKVAYSAHDTPLEGRVSNRLAEDIVDTHMAIFIMGFNASSGDHKSIRWKQKDIVNQYPSWLESKNFTRHVQRQVVNANGADAEFANGQLSFNATSRVVEEIMERYGHWQNRDCKDLKSVLMKAENKNTGRVLLKDFYGGNQGGHWQFVESVEYLRDLGALDESTPQQSVIIPNYINAHSNCLFSSGIFSVCCLNECEALLGHLEREVGAPDAEPEQLLELVARLPSSTVEAPRQVSAELRGLLEEVAQQHGGKVILHGRLFGQWLHHAYPRECPYPHKAGTINPMIPTDWIGEKGKSSFVSADEMLKHKKVGMASCTNTTAGCGGYDTIDTKPAPLLWTMEEELVVSTTASPSSRTSHWRACLLTNCMALLALTSLAATLRPNLKSVLRAFGLCQLDVLPFAGKVHAC